MVLLPSLNRIDGLTGFMKAAIETETSVPGLVLVDKKDFDTKKSTYAELKDHYFPEGWDYRITNGITMGDKVREVWHEVEDRDWVGILNDDHRPITLHWDKKLISQLTGKNFITCNDRWMAPKKAAGLTAWSMPLMKECGFQMFLPGMHHLFIDDLWEHIGKHTGTWDIDMSVVVEHRHVLKRESPMDATHQKTYARPAWENDRIVYEKFMKEEMPALIAKIQKFVLDVTLSRIAHG